MKSRLSPLCSRVYRLSRFLCYAGLSVSLLACSTLPTISSPSSGLSGLSGLRGTHDLGVVIERANGQVAIVDTSQQKVLAEVAGIGDISHASVVFSRDGRYAYVFARDGGLSKVDLLTATLVKRVVQAGNSIGGAVSQDGKLVIAQNYEPGGIRVFAADTLELLSEVPSTYGSQSSQGGASKRAKVVGLADLPGNKVAYALFEAGEIWVTDLSDPRQPKTEKYRAGEQPYDGLVTPNGRYFLAGLYGEDGLALFDSWHPELGVRKILSNYGRGQERLPVFKMPHLRGWAIAGTEAWLPAIGRHEVLVVDTKNWQEVRRVAVKGQPVFVMARPDGREILVNFAFPDNDWVQVIDSETGKIRHTFSPGKAVLHMEFTPRGEAVWFSARDSHQVSVYGTQDYQLQQQLNLPSPSGIFFTPRAGRMGF